MVTSRIKRKTLHKLPKKILGHSKTKVGFPSSKVSKDILMRAIWNHFGTNRKGGNGGTHHIPERPFLYNAMHDNASEYKKILRDSAGKILLGEVPVGLVINKLGLLAQSHVQTEIIDLRDPANALSTIKKKGSSNPLVDTGEMVNSVTYITHA